MSVRARIEDAECLWSAGRYEGAVIAVLHDLNLAARYANRILMLHEGKTVAQGPPEEALCPDIIKNVYGIDCVVWKHPSGCPWVVPLLNDGAPGGTGNPREEPRHQERGAPRREISLQST